MLKKPIIKMVLFVGIGNYDVMADLESCVNDFDGMVASAETTNLSDAEITKSFDENQDVIEAKMGTFKKRVEHLTRVEKQKVFV